MNLSSYLIDVVVEFPRIKYILSVKKSCKTDYEYVALSPSYKPTASYYFRWFRNMLSNCNLLNSYEKITEMIAVFTSCKDEIYVNVKEYVLLEGLLLVCFRLKLEDSNLVCEVLNLLYSCWRSFGPLHFAVIIGVQRRRNSSSHLPNLITFFLEHARRERLQFDGIRMIDISIYNIFKKAAVLTAAEMWNWKIMLIYLQYGAKFEKTFQDHNTSVFDQYRRSTSTLTGVLRKLLNHLWFQLVHPALLQNGRQIIIAQYLENLRKDVRDLCCTLNILLRALRRIEFGSLDYIIKEIDVQNTIRLIPSQDVMKHSTVKFMIPKLITRYQCPEELKHICRWMIRKRLNENWQLPHGIRDLPVPDSLKRYLNLLAD